MAKSKSLRTEITRNFFIFQPNCESWANSGVNRVILTPRFLQRVIATARAFAPASPATPAAKNSLLLIPIVSFQVFISVLSLLSSVVCPATLMADKLLSSIVCPLKLVRLWWIGFVWLCFPSRQRPGSFSQSFCK